jgi:starvation-inducible DNA-binding protein
MMFESTLPRTDEDRQRIADVLNPCVASGIDLYNAAKFAHWNVRGPAFGPLHALFGDVASVAAEQVDILAERVSQVGVLALGTTQQVAAESRLDDMPTDETDGYALCRILFDRVRQCVALLSQARNDSDDLGALDTSQLLSDAILAFDKLGWMLVAHIPRGA